MLGGPEVIRREQLQLRVLGAVLIKFFVRTEGPPTYEVQDLRLGQGLTVSPPIWHLRNAEHQLKSIIRDRECLDALLIQVPSGWHGPPKLFYYLKRGFLCTSGLKPIVFPGLIVVILTSDDLPKKTLEIVGAFAVWGVLHSIV